jgi:hypothetical protein
MKTLLALVALSLLTLPAMAQERTLIDGEFHSSGFGGPNLKVTRLNNEWGLMVGGGGAWYINHAFAIGGAGYGLVTNHLAPKVAGMDTARYFNFGYGGGTLEYVVMSDDLLHFSVNTLVGAGAVNHRFGHFGIDQRNEWDHGDAFFVVEPGVNVEANITKYMRIDVGGSYRWVNGIELDGLSNKDFSGPSANLTLKFGSF